MLYFSAVDYDAGENFFRLVIGVDSGPDSLEVTVAVTVTPVNEDPPVFNVPDVLVLSEDAAVGTTISSLKATDQDIAPHDIVKYEMASGIHVTSLTNIATRYTDSVYITRYMLIVKN